MKEGWKTTEAWILAVVSYLTSDVVMSNNDPQVKITALICGTAAAAVYIWSRAHVKANCGTELPEVKE